MTQFLYSAGMSKLCSSFSVSFNSALYGTFCFVKGSIKSEQNALVFDWLTFGFLIILLWSAIYIYIWKHYKWNVVKLSKVAVVCSVLQNRCSLEFCNKHREKPVLKSLFNNVVSLQAIRPATILKSGSDAGVSLCILQNFYEQLFA